MTLASIPILAVWDALGGEAPRGKRVKAFWRNGDGYSVAVDAAKGTWCDYRDGIGGGVLALVKHVRGCSQSDALQWLEQNCGLDTRRPLSPVERTQYAQRINEHSDAKSWAIAVRALSESVLDELESNDPSRADFTQLLSVIYTGGSVLVERYRAWCDAQPELTRAMVRAGRNADARAQRRVALFVVAGLTNAA